MFPHRPLCSVLDEIREMDKVKNYSYLLSLVEELQTLGNRMEAALWYQNDLKKYHKESRAAKKKLKKIQKKLKDAERKWERKEKEEVQA